MKTGIEEGARPCGSEEEAKWTAARRSMALLERRGDLIVNREGNPVALVREHDQCILVNRIHLHVSCPPELAPSKIAQYIKGRSSRLIQQEFPHLRKRYWGKHLWARGYFCASVGKLTEKMIAAYIEQQDVSTPDDVFKVSDE